ncbi:MAG: PEP-CTERM system histidine kinase PrsK [Gammaproteobacteria bacterium]|nr:MAG: PEP-CTERM system histidine kinase PrsK [Gammaproteobacteria bacterium]
MNVGLFSYLAAFIAYLALTILLIFSWRRNAAGIRVLVASISTTVWAGLATVSTVFVLSLHEALEEALQPAIQIAELARDAGWCLLMLNILELQKEEKLAGAPISKWTKLFVVILAVAISILFIAPFFMTPTTSITSITSQNDTLDSLANLSLMVWVTLALIGLLLVEQVFRNTTPAQRWSIKYLCIGVGLIFAYDFYLYSDALLFRQVSPPLWDARGLVNAIAVPLIAISIARNPTWDLGIHVSRTIVFHSATLLGAGFYLLIMAGVGYYVRYYGGTWGGVLQVGFLCAAGILLIILLFSDKIRAQGRVLISKHFFSYKHDYREEWLKFTQTIASGDEEVPYRVIRALASLVNSDGALIWTKNEGNQLSISADWNMAVPEPDNPDWSSQLLTFIESTGWIIDLDEYRQDPESYRGLALPEELISMDKAWLIVPLLLQSKALGIVVIKRSNINQNINWEDRDLLKMAGQQAATYLAQYLTDKALIQARQFEAFNRLSAYVIHDLKNILAQQSLIVANAEKHKDKPEFIDDVFTTITNSVSRMTRLMEQMKRGARGNESTDFKLSELLSNVVTRRAMHLPTPTLKTDVPYIVARADQEQLATVFTHIVQNAQEATENDGKISISLVEKGNQAIIEIRDNGSGMDADFIEHRLFQPFESTKGLTGMGIGLFESREYLRSIGGDIKVYSKLGSGSVFRIQLPCQTPVSDENNYQAVPE